MLSVPQAVPADSVIAERVVLGAVEAYRALPFADVDATAVARRAGVAVADVERTFPHWDALLLVTYDRWVDLREAARHTVPSSTVDFVRMTLAEDVADPGLVRVLAGAINVAGARTSFTDLFRNRYEEYHAALVRGLAREFAAAPAAEQPAVAPEHAATQLLALYQGLQIQMLIRPHVDVLQQYDIAAETLRAGWSAHTLHTWDLDGAEDPTALD